MPRLMKSGGLLRVAGRLPRPIVRMLSKSVAAYCSCEINRMSCPAQLTIFLTEMCGLNCPHCFLGDAENRSADRITAEDIEKLCKKNARCIKRVNLTGGEVFLLPDIKEICFLLDKYLRLENLTIATNALIADKVVNLTEEFLKHATTGLSIQISLDGPPEFHDKFRGCPGLFTRAISVAQSIKNNYAGHRNLERVFFSVVLHKQNLPFLDDMVRIIQELDVETEWSFIRSPAESVARVPIHWRSIWALGNDALMLEVREMEGALKVLKEKLWSKKAVSTPSDAVSWVRMQKVIDFYKTSFWAVPCTAGRSDAVITSHADLALCEMTKPVVSLKEFDWDIGICLRKSGASKLPLLWKCSCAHECNINNSLKTDPSALSEIVKMLGRK